MATNDVRNWLKLNLLMDKACLVFRQIFQMSWKTNFGREWSGTQGDINVMLAQTQMKNIGKQQRKTILSGDVNSWDLTTLRVILTSKGFLNLTAQEMSSIHRIANIRNKLAHSASKDITDYELNAHLCAASEILVKFGESEADLELLKQESRAGGVEFIQKDEPVSYESTLEARRLKEAGNAQFQSENWEESIKIYTQAILLPGLTSADRATLYSNRSVAFLKKKELSLALKDAKKSIDLCPECWRGHFRMGQIYTAMNKYKKAEGCFDEAFAGEPQREEINEARSYAHMKGEQLERNDVVDAHFVFQTDDDVISEFQRRTTCQVNAEAIKKMFNANVNNDFMRNWQDCQTGADWYPRDYVIAAQYYKKAADRGSADGLCMLAGLTMEGKGVKRDIQLGIKLLKQAAEQPPIRNGIVNVGVADAEHTLGLYFENGIGVTKNESAAMDWYQKACEHGSVTAANNLGLIYQKKGNHVKAEQYLKMASKAGNARAMVNLASYYCLEGNADFALTWCQRARNSREFGTEIDNIEKACEDLILQFKASGVKEWESKNAKVATGLSMTERMERFAYQTIPYMADCFKALNEFAKKVAKNKDEIYRASGRFPTDQLEKYANTSLYARELLKAQNHFFAAMAALIKLGVFKFSQMALCEKFIRELSSCAKIEFSVAALPVEWHRHACSLVDQLLTMETAFHEDTCICYIALHWMTSLESSVPFVSECIRKYPQNAHFRETRGQMYAFLKRYEDGLRDINAAITLDPSMYKGLYYRAAMMRLFYPKVSSEETTAAYKDFLAVAPEDHRKVPETFYGIAQMLDLATTLDYPDEILKIDLSATKHSFYLGVEAERKQLPFFLPYQSTAKASVEMLIQSMEIHALRNEQPSGVAKTSKPQVAEPAGANLLEQRTIIFSEQHQAHKAEMCTASRKVSVLRPALSDPSRENLIKNLRKIISNRNAKHSSGVRIVSYTFKASKIQKSASSLIGLHAITLNEIDYRQDKIYNGYVLAVTIIEDIAFMASMHTIIEDSSGDVILCAIYNWPNAEDRVKARKEFGIGCKISIINPYMRMALHGQSLIRVDDPKSIIFHGFLEKMCRYCCEPNANKSCAICKASYCDKKCQMLDWKRDHKLICSVNR